MITSWSADAKKSQKDRSEKQYTKVFLHWKRCADISVPEWDYVRDRKGIIASELKVSPAEVVPASSRAPMRPIEMCILAEDGGDDDE